MADTKPAPFPGSEAHGLPIQRSWFRSQQALPTGKVKSDFETTYAERQLAGSLNVALEVNGVVIANGVVPDFNALALFKGKIAEVKVKYLR